MNATSVAIDLAKNIFQLAVADASWRVVERHRLTRSQLERWFANRRVDLVIMEACGSAHHWGRWLNARGIEVKLLLAAYVRAYVKRNKTDAADACALLEARGSRGVEAGQGEIGRTAGGARAASHPFFVDGNAHQPQQCASRVLPRVRHGDRARQPRGRRADEPRARRSPIRCAAHDPRYDETLARGDSSLGSAHWRARAGIG
jgi:hypothetical protein